MIKLEITAVDGLASSLGTREPKACPVAEDGAHASTYKPKGSR